MEKNSIDIILGIDDVISMGYRESVTIQEVCDQLKMESADEKAHLALLKQQEEDAREAAKKAADKNKKWVCFYLRTLLIYLFTFFISCTFTKIEIKLVTIINFVCLKIRVWKK